MRNFVLGIVVTILVLLIGSLGLALLGFLPTRANTTPPAMESHIAMSAMDSSVERHAPRVNNPVPPTDENLIEGVKIYTMNCALCHGGIDRQNAGVGQGAVGDRHLEGYGTADAVKQAPSGGADVLEERQRRGCSQRASRPRA